MVTDTGVSPVRLTVTGIFTVVDVSSPVHWIPVGVPVTFPSVPTVNPFVGVEVIFASALFAVTTGVLPLVYSRPSIAFVLGFAGVAFSTSSTATSTSSLLPSGYATSTVT